VQRQAAEAVEAARADCEGQLQRLSGALRGELNALRGKVTLLRDEVRQRLAAASKQLAARLGEVSEKWQQRVAALQAAHAAADEEQRRRHAEATAALQRMLDDARSEAERLRAHEAEVGAQLAGLKHRVLDSLRQRAQRIAEVNLSSGSGGGAGGGAGAGSGGLVNENEAVQAAEAALASEAPEQVLLGVEAAWGCLLSDLAAVAEDRDQLLSDSAALASDLSSCATNLQVRAAVVV